MTGTFDSQAAMGTSFKNLTQIFRDLGAGKLYVKALAPNDNSKNQPYLGSHLSDVAFIPTGEPVASPTTSKKTISGKRRIKFQVPLDFSWVDATGTTYPAPNAKLIYYPQYPEVRLSGFLQNSCVDAGEWMDPYRKGRNPGRWLILGATPEGKVYAYLATPECRLSSELRNAAFVKVSTVFSQIDINQTIQPESTRDALIRKLTEIHHLGWLSGQKLNTDMSITPYKAPNGGGYTLEAQLGVIPNGSAEPDYLGWEVKQFGVTRFPSIGAKPTTLMTPEPDGGIYCSHGADVFVRRYGYADRSGKEDRLNFGGRHICDIANPLTHLKLVISGFDKEISQITDAQGAIELLDDMDNIAASWSFAKLMGHWKKKHAQAVYVPCMKRVSHSGIVQYRFGRNIELGIGTDFERMLASFSDEITYYDPGIKLECSSTERPRIKRRSQFRISHRNLSRLYKKFEFLDILEDQELKGN